MSAHAHYAHAYSPVWEANYGATIAEALKAFEMSVSLDAEGCLEFRTDDYAVTLLDRHTTLEISERNGRIVRAVLSGQPKEHNAKTKTCM